MNDKNKWNPLNFNTLEHDKAAGLKTKHLSIGVDPYIAILL